PRRPGHRRPDRGPPDAGGGRVPAAVRAQRLPDLPVHPGLHLRDRAPWPQPADRVQRPDLARPRGVLRDRRLHDRDHDRPLGGALRLDDPGGRPRLPARRLPVRNPGPPAGGALPRARDLRPGPRGAADPQALRRLDRGLAGHRPLEAVAAGGAPAQPRPVALLPESGPPPPAPPARLEPAPRPDGTGPRDRKSTRLNSSHVAI